MGVIVTITEQSGNDLVDYPIKVEITDPGFFEECPDQKYIECYFQDGSWIPHFTELFDPANNKAVIWVKVPQIPANGTVKVFIKVNPSRTEDLSNGEAVFEFFDDFEGTELDTSKWSINGNPSFTFLDGIMYMVCDSHDDLIYSNAVFDASQRVLIIEAKMKWDGNRYGEGGIIACYDPSTKRHYWIYPSSWDNTFRVEKRSDLATAVSSNKLPYSYQANVWFTIKAIIDIPNSLIKGIIDDELGNHQEVSITDSEYTSGRVGIRNANHYVDWIRVRSIVEPEPTVSVEYVPETVTYTNYFYWGMAKMLSGAIANFMQLPIKMEVYSGGNLLKTLSLKEISTITDAENKYIISVLKFEDDSSDSYQTDKQVIYVTDPNGNLRKLAESTYVFIKMAELPLLLGFEIRIPYEDTQVEL